MKKQVCFFVGLLVSFTIFSNVCKAQKVVPDTVKTGIYITSIHDIDFRQQEYYITFWLWLTYKNKDFNFLENLEVPLAKTVTRSYATVDSSGKEIYMLMKLQCLMKDSWKINDFPFDKQKLRLSIENSQYDADSLVFAADTLGKHFDPRFTLSLWNIDTCKITIANKIYETAFGDATTKIPRSNYSSYRVSLSISRNAVGLFWKLFIGMYIAFLIAFICFFIHSDKIDSRFGLSVGALFAVVGNKYIIDSALPESSTFTLVDTLHGITLVFILAVITATAYSLHLVKKNKLDQARKFDMASALLVIILYLILNIYFISQATSG